jgi:hypothetical protein
MMIRTAPLRALTPFLALLAACGGTGGRSAVTGRPERLEGRWSVDLRLERPLQLHRDTAAAGTVHAELVLIRNPAPQGGPTHFGAYAADFAPFGFASRAGRVPAVAARLLGGDSVEIALDPGGSRRVMLRGKLAGDSVAGHWRYDAGRRRAAAGRFVMRRG